MSVFGYKIITLSKIKVKCTKLNAICSFEIDDGIQGNMKQLA